MGYTKTWIPPTVPFRDDLNAWKITFNDIHDNLIEAGLVQTADSGQLDIDSVEELPPDGEFAGYRVYRFNDNHQATCPIFIRLDFGCGIEGLSSGVGASSRAHRRTRCLRCRVTVSSGSDGSGNLNDVTPLIQSEYPQGYRNDDSTNVTQLTTPGFSVVTANQERGFFGFVYGIGSRNNPPTDQISGSYSGCTLAILIQRDIKDNIVQDTGFSVYMAYSYASGIGGLNTPASGPDLKMMYWRLDKGASASMQTNSAAARPMGLLASPVSGMMQVHSIGVLNGDHTLGYCPSLFSYRTGDMTTGNTFQVTPFVNGPSSTFVALGPGTLFRTDDNSLETTSIAMLYE